MFPDAAEKALAAKAIAARTDLLQKIGTRHLTDPYLLCSSQHCQVYAGADREHPRTTRAVERTRGQVLGRDGGGGAPRRRAARWRAGPPAASAPTRWSASWPRRRPTPTAAARAGRR